MFRSILVAIDGSSHADRALSHAIDLAECADSRLTLFTAIAPPPAVAVYGAAVAGLKDLIDDASVAAATILARARDRVPDDVSVTTVLTMRPVESALVRQVNEGRHDLVVMGSRGRGRGSLDAARQRAADDAQAVVTAAYYEAARRELLVLRIRPQRVAATIAAPSATTSCSTARSRARRPRRVVSPTGSARDIRESRLTQGVCDDRP